MLLVWHGSGKVFFQEGLTMMGGRQKGGHDVDRSGIGGAPTCRPQILIRGGWDDCRIAGFRNPAAHAGCD